MTISNAQRAHDLATSLIPTLHKENSETLDIWKTYTGLYTVILRDLDYRFPDGLPERFSDFPDNTLEGVPWKD